MKMAASDDVDDNDEESQGDECRLESSTYTGGQTNFTFDEIEKLGPVLNTKFVETSDPDVWVLAIVNFLKNYSWQKGKNSDSAS